MGALKIENGAGLENDSGLKRMVDSLNTRDLRQYLPRRQGGKRRQVENDNTRCHFVSDFDWMPSYWYF